MMINYWWKVPLLLCVFGFLKETRPSDPFIVKVLTGHWKNLTIAEINAYAYPVQTYSLPVWLVLSFLLTDLCRYKPFIVLTGLCGIIYEALIAGTTALVYVQIGMCFTGAFSAFEVAYYTYIYAKIDKEHYCKVTSMTRAATLAGKMLSFVLAQCLISFDVLNYLQLCYISIGSLVLAVVWSLFLPSVKRSIYFHRDETENDIIPFHKKFKPAFLLMKNQFVESFTKPTVIRWSFYYIFVNFIGTVPLTYMQAMFIVIDGKDSASYNAIVEAALCLLAVFAAMMVGYIKIDWTKRGEIIMLLMVMVQGGLVLWTSYTKSIWEAYSSFVIDGAIFHASATIATAQIAKDLPEDSFGLVFGINMFIATCLRSVFTAIFINNSSVCDIGDPRCQYVVMGLFQFLVVPVFVVLRIMNCRKN